MSDHNGIEDGPLPGAPGMPGAPNPYWHGQDGR